MISRNIFWWERICNFSTLGTLKVWSRLLRKNQNFFRQIYVFSSFSLIIDFTKKYFSTMQRVKLQNFLSVENTKFFDFLQKKHSVNRFHEIFCSNWVNFFLQTYQKISSVWIFLVSMTGLYLELNLRNDGAIEIVQVDNEALEVMPEILVSLVCNENPGKKAWNKFSIAYNFTKMFSYYSPNCVEISESQCVFAKWEINCHPNFFSSNWFTVKSFSKTLNWRKICEKTA